MLSALTLATALSIGSWFGFGESEPEPPPGRVVQDLHYGDVLYYYYQDEYFEAMVRLLAARQMGRAEPHALDGELLMGGMLLSFGQHEAAADIFRRLLDTQAEPEVRDRAWFYLGMESYRRGAYEQALDAIGRIGDTLGKNMAREAQMLRAQSLIDLSRFDEAATVLEQTDWGERDDWALYARYNLGVALVRASRIDEGATQLDTVGSTAAGNAERLELRDRANLALGYTYLQTERPSEALDVLKRVRLHGESANKALLGYGWAHLELGDTGAALVAWQELVGRDPHDAAVQEALLAVPFAFAELQQPEAAIEQYQRAISIYAEESAHVDGLIERVQSGALIDALLAEDDPAVPSWQWTLDELPDMDLSRTLMPVLSSHHFQEGLKNVRDLRLLETRLSRNADDMAAFDDMIESRRLRFAELEPEIGAKLDQIDIGALHDRHAGLSSRYDDTVKQRDIAGFASVEQKATLDRVESIKARLAAMPPSPQTRQAAEKLRLIEGLVRWDLDREFKYQTYHQREELDAIDAALVEAENRLASTRAARDNGPIDFDAFATRVADGRSRVTTMQTATDALLQRSYDDLKNQAIGELRRYQARLRRYSIDSRFELARLYDRLSTGAPVMDPGAAVETRPVDESAPAPEATP